MAKFVNLVAISIVAITALLARSTTGFTTAPSHHSRMRTVSHESIREAGIVLYAEREGRTWNFNEGQSPWGMKRNAEVWNSRCAMMAFTIVFLQELITGKGVVQGMQEGNPVNLAAAGLTALTFAGLTGFLALKGDNDYVKKELEG